MTGASWLLRDVIALAVAFTRDPVPDVGSAVQQLDPALLAAAQEPHRADVHQRHLLEVQRLAWSRVVDLRLDLGQALHLEPTDQANKGAAVGGNPLDAQRHWLTVAVLATSPRALERQPASHR